MDTACRIGGDEFIVIIPDVEVVDFIDKQCRDLINKISQPIDYQQSKVQVGVSIGVAVFPDHAEGSKKLRRVADELMYKVKKTGKNNFKIAPF